MIDLEELQELREWAREVTLARLEARETFSIVDEFGFERWEPLDESYGKGPDAWRCHAGSAEFTYRDSRAARAAIDRALAFVIEARS